MSGVMEAVNEGMRRFKVFLEKNKIDLKVSGYMVADNIEVFLKHPGLISAIDVEKLKEAFKKLFGEDVEVKVTKSKYIIGISIRSPSIRFGITCVKEYMGCQAEGRVKDDYVICKRTCYANKDGMNAARIALALAYANVPSEYAGSAWGASLKPLGG